MTTMPAPSMAGEFTVRLQRQPNIKLGLRLDGKDGQSLLVEKVNVGLVKAWNDANPSLAIQPGDRIVSVNGVRGEPQLLIEQTAEEKSPVITLTVVPGRPRSNAQ